MLKSKPNAFSRPREMHLVLGELDFADSALLVFLTALGMPLYRGMSHGAHAGSLEPAKRWRKIDKCGIFLFQPVQGEETDKTTNLRWLEPNCMDRSSGVVWVVKLWGNLWGLYAACPTYFVEANGW